MTDPKDNNKLDDLAWYAAIWNSIIDRDIAFFPRTGSRTEARTLDNGEIIKAVVDGLEGLTLDDAAEVSKGLLERGRESLDEVKALTEYQDQKAVRLLTVVAFFTALAGVLIGKFSDAHPIATYTGIWSWAEALVGLVYILLGLFVGSVVCGALVIFHGNRTRFRYPALSGVKAGATAKSFLFFPSIIELAPRDWAASFTQSAEGNGLAPSSALSLQYAKNYITESYLVAAKVADKLRYLERGQDILAFALKTLLAWLVVLAVASGVVPAKAPEPLVPAPPVAITVHFPPDSAKNLPTSVGSVAKEEVKGATGVTGEKAGTDGG